MLVSNLYQQLYHKMNIKQHKTALTNCFSTKNASREGMNCSSIKISLDFGRRFTCVWIKCSFLLFTSHLQVYLEKVEQCPAPQVMPQFVFLMWKNTGATQAFKSESKSRQRGLFKISTSRFPFLSQESVQC